MGEMLWLQKWISEVDDPDGERLSVERAVARVQFVYNRPRRRRPLGYDLRGLHPMLVDAAGWGRLGRK